MVPVADILNHSSDHNVEIYYGENELRMTTIKDIACVSFKYVCSLSYYI